MTTPDSELLREFARDRSEEVFATLVSRHVDLVYSAALRQVRSPELAKDVAQTVFIDLSRNAEKLAPDTILTAWLYRVTRRAAIDVVRSESHRQIREKIAVELAAMNSPDTNWKEIEPLLDEAMETLDDTDRSSILLRYFENKSLREVGQTLGTSDDAAQKRVSRAVERLREFFSKRGVTIGASGLAVAISGNAVQAAPIGFALTISSTLAATALASATTATAIKTVAMTTLQKNLITAIIVAAVGGGIYQAREASNLREQVESLKQQQQSAPANQLQQLVSERDNALRQLANLREENKRLNQNFAELIRLRNEVGLLRDSQKVKMTPKALTLKIEPDIFLRNVSQRADETINTSSNHYSDILLDVLKMEGCDLGTNQIILDKKKGEISMENSPENLEIFQRVVEELNRADGQRGPFSASPRREPVLIAAQIYKMDTEAFEKLNLGESLGKGSSTDGERAEWVVPQDLIKSVREILNSANDKLLSSPRVQTSRGIPAELSVGSSGDFLTFKCLPISVHKSGLVELKVRTEGKFSTGNFPESWEGTNMTSVSKTYLESGSGFIVRYANPKKGAPNNLVLFFEMNLL